VNPFCGWVKWDQCFEDRFGRRYACAVCANELNRLFKSREWNFRMVFGSITRWAAFDGISAHAFQKRDTFYAQLAFTIVDELRLHSKNGTMFRQTGIQSIRGFLVGYRSWSQWGLRVIWLFRNWHERDLSRADFAADTMKLE